MKYCKKCGAQLLDEAVVCINCGCQVENKPAEVSGLKIAARVLMLLTTIAVGWSIIPLAWCIPMTVSYWKKTNNGEPISTGFKVCTLLFVSLIAGILMLCDED